MIDWFSFLLHFRSMFDELFPICLLIESERMTFVILEYDQLWPAMWSSSFKRTNLVGDSNYVRARVCVYVAEKKTLGAHWSAESQERTQSLNMESFKIILLWIAAFSRLAEPYSVNCTALFHWISAWKAEKSKMNVDRREASNRAN